KIYKFLLHNYSSLKIFFNHIQYRFLSSYLQFKMNSLKQLLYYRLNKDNEELILFIVSLPELLNLSNVSYNFSELFHRINSLLLFNCLYFYRTLILLLVYSTS